MCIINWPFWFTFLKASIMQIIRRCRSCSTKLFVRKARIPFQFINNIWLIDLWMWVLKITLLDIIIDFIIAGICEISFVHCRFSAIFLSSKVIVPPYLWGGLNLLHLLWNGFAQGGCLLELYLEKLMKQLQLQWTD